MKAVKNAVSELAKLQNPGARSAQEATRGRHRATGRIGGSSCLSRGGGDVSGGFIVRRAVCIRRGDLHAAPIRGPIVDITQEDGIVNAHAPFDGIKSSGSCYCHYCDASSAA